MHKVVSLRSNFLKEPRMDDDEITLEIEDTSIKCSKKLLSSHSDYFRIMFEGAFIERNKSVIKLHVSNHRSN